MVLEEQDSALYEKVPETHSEFEAQMPQCQVKVSREKRAGVTRFGVGRVSRFGHDEASYTNNTHDHKLVQLFVLQEPSPARHTPLRVFSLCLCLCLCVLGLVLWEGCEDPFVASQAPLGLPP